MRLSPGCYGKLPLHGDFIRHHVPGSEVGLLDEWIQAGIVSSRQALGASWDGLFDAAPPQRFLFQAAPGGRVLAGVVGPSHDKPGRRFPFLIFAAADPREAGLEPTLVPAACSAFLEGAEAAARSAGSGGDLKAFLARVDALPGGVDAEAVRKAVQGAWAAGAGQALWQKLFGSPQDPRKYLLVHNLVETLRSGAVPRYVLRLPGVSDEGDVSFWLDLGRRLSRRPGLPTLAMWRRGGEGGQGGLTLLYDALKASYFLPLWWPDRKSTLLFPLADPAEGPDQRLQQARERYAGILEDPSLRLGALLSKFG
jgi:type VI secretion system protein ImpM